ncbi:GNAT family N-acetyltransferase [Gorillibacterium sp. CAU 1737]|uniref:GNAT family N-acetyltransferase n=1 Tax=Gorillibacterium sp. CAU 1737 TaxID=3140362 RepID=UPI003260E829
MVIWEKADPESVSRELALRNLDAFYNRVTEGKDMMTLQDMELDREEGQSFGAERFLLRLEGEDVGIFDYLYRTGEKPWIGLLFIAPAHRSKGLARLVLASYFSQFREGGHTVCRLAVVEGNEPAHRFWQSLGFNAVAKTVSSTGNAVDVYERMIEDDFISSLNGGPNR